MFTDPLHEEFAGIALGAAPDAEGAGMHCEGLNRSMAMRRMLDWLDDTLGHRPS